MTLYAFDDIQPDLQDGHGFIAPDASLIGRVRLMRGASIWYQVVARGDNEWITVGEGSNIQDGSVLHTDPGAPCTVGRRVTVGHKVILHGCMVGDMALIGMGSTVMNHAKIGEKVILGAGSLVPEGKEIPAGKLALGSPAKVIRDLKPEEEQLLEASAEVYIRNSARHLKELREITD